MRNGRLRKVTAPDRRERGSTSVVSLPLRSITALLTALAAFGSTACTGTRLLANPTVMLETEGGLELGVSTDYGVIFLGRTANAGDVDVTAWFGDGPSIEPTIIEPIGGGLYTAEMEIRLPSVPLRFEEPIPGQRLYMIGMRRNRMWIEKVTVRSDPRVEGILVGAPDIVEFRDQIGAGLYWMPEEDDLLHMELVGLVSGRMRIERDGQAREYLTVVGPTTLWRMVAHRRNQLERKRWIYRDDIM
jgi:hypothetical protein